MTTSLSMAAPERLEPVRRFGNTLDVEAGTDAIEDAAGLRIWLAEAGLWRGDGQVRATELRRARAVRGALRAAASANHDGALLPPAVRTVLDEAAARAGIVLSFAPERTWRAAPTAVGVDGAMGELVLRVTEAMTAGTWPRLKVCAGEPCRWVFYDTSRAGTGKWCSMRLCGNRAKQEAWRTRQRATK